MTKQSKEVYNGRLNHYDYSDDDSWFCRWLSCGIYTWQIYKEVKMKDFQVKIIKSSQPTYWYAKEIGKVFSVSDFNKKDYVLSGKNEQDSNEDYYILKEDCEIEYTHNSKNRCENSLCYFYLSNHTCSAHTLGLGAGFVDTKDCKHQIHYKETMNQINDIKQQIIKLSHRTVL